MRGLLPLALTLTACADPIELDAPEGTTSETDAATGPEDQFPDWPPDATVLDLEGGIATTELLLVGETLDGPLWLWLQLTAQGQTAEASVAPARFEGGNWVPVGEPVALDAWFDPASSALLVSGSVELVVPLYGEAAPIQDLLMVVAQYPGGAYCGDGVVDGAFGSDQQFRFVALPIEDVAGQPDPPLICA